MQGCQRNAGWLHDYQIQIIGKRLKSVYSGVLHQANVEMCNGI